MLVPLFLMVRLVLWLVLECRDEWSTVAWIEGEKSSGDDLSRHPYIGRARSDVF
eukprot:SAG11_NODE_34194_length_273_cov_0.827586_1_plen_53_part_10